MPGSIHLPGEHDQICRLQSAASQLRYTYIECEKSGRECVPFNVRFRHLECPSGRITRADYSKHQFFFDGEQTWIDTNGKLEFVARSDSSANASPTNELENNIFGAVSLNAEPRPALLDQPSSTFVLGSSSHTPTVHASVVDEEPPDYLAALEQVPHDQSGSLLLDKVSRTPAHLMREASEPGEKLRSDTSVSYLGRVLPAPELAWPLKILQEGKLFQHFVTHLAPWVCTNVFLVP